MTYKKRGERTVIENDGNVGLFVDGGNILYTEVDGKKVKFYLPSVPEYANGITLGRVWWGSHSYSWYAAERVGDYIKLIDRTFAKPDSMRAYLKDKTGEEYAMTFLYEIINFELDGGKAIFVGGDIPTSDPFGLSTDDYKYGVQSHSDYIKTFAYRLTSPLEQWAMSDESILNEFINAKTISNEKDKNILLEDWAYKKYVELYPGEKVPSTYGIEGNYPSAENAYFGKKTLTGNFRDYKFYNRGSGKYEIKTDSGFDEITGMTLEFIDKTIDAVDDIKGVFDQVTGLNTDSGNMFRLYNAAFA